MAAVDRFGDDAGFDLGRLRRALPAAVSSTHWRVAGILFLIAAEAILYGYSYPFFSLALEKHGIANWLIGLNASLAGAGILIVGPFLPRLIAGLGLRYLVASLFLISLLSFALLLTTDLTAVWFVSRFVMGACFAALWTTTEIWLNGVVDDRHRGRIIGASGTLYAGAQFVGPLALSVTGVTGTLPLIAAMVPLAAGVIVALSIRTKAGERVEAKASGSDSLRLALALAGPLMATACLAGVTETAMQSLLPLYGLANGLSDSEASRLVALFSVGEALLVAALGWMADRYGRRRTLGLCVALALTVMVLLPASIAWLWLLGPALFLAGGAISGIYTLGVIQIGQDYRGQRLAVVSTGFAMAYAVGAVVGSTPMGLAIDLFGPRALPILIAACFLLLAVVILKSRRPAATAADALIEVAPAPPLVAEAPLPSGVLLFDEFKPVDVEQAEVGDLQMGNDRQWQESNLEEWFRQRAAELARRAAKRHHTSTNHLEGLKTHQTG